jgi:acetylornithine deacetylase/succinyl-diaminopimelate desuccinylase-like protein
LHYGLRGLLQISATVSGPKRHIHSGVDGGVIREPMIDLIHLLSGLVDCTGHVTIPGFYDNVREISPAEEEFYASIDFDIQEYKQNLGVSQLLTDDPKQLLMKRWRFPTLSIHSIGTPSTSTTGVIPSSVPCKISVRLVPDQVPERVFSLIHNYLRQKVKYETPLCFQDKILNELLTWFILGSLKN